MRVSVISLLIVASAAYHAVAQSASGLPADTCIVQCLSQSASSVGCDTYADLVCICQASSYQKTVTSCLQSKCTSGETNLAQAWYQDSCAAVSAALSLSSDVSTFTKATATLSITDAAQASSLESKYSSFTAFLSAEYSSISASYSRDYDVLSSSLSVLDASATATSASAGTSARLDASVVKTGLVSCVVAMLGVAFGVVLVF
ncbi:uncharacterized protein C8Q71DRAFT_773249 [Rhodofomes roseus]|uniref:CFEM domain-containing protein n=1 Tax=Rhodofomes roseus TaxID=34475 RepID=A0A4Y9YCN8_9APHY|nr:uncharacterized protein C8Q71DRAFT_773249 [Rhodofomes roseus]KAH9833409.1 hypothetical protein C8Q71DRAFT_773249 [Rhodofomes roseus]TFY59221.1 hypothetical protein EVJ58_g5910 [Rhodofomes roseus]